MFSNTDTLFSRFSRTVRNVWRFYYDGFREMTVGKTLWAIILIKIFIFFFVIKLLFFPDILSRDYDNDADRASHVRHELTRPNY